MEGNFTSITVKKPGGKSFVTITPEGIWVSNAKGLVASSIQLQDGLPVVTVMDHRKSKQHAHQIALSVDEKGEPCVQVSRGEEIINVSGAELIDMLKVIRWLCGE